MNRVLLMRNQSKPPINSSFDDLAEAGVADASPSPIPPQRRVGHFSGPRPHQYDTDRTSGGSESDIDELSDLSEVETSLLEGNNSSSSPPRRVVVKRVGISLNPSGGVPRGRRKPQEPHDPNDDTIPKLKPLHTRRQSGVIPLKISDSNFLKSDPNSEDEEDLGDPEKPPEPSSPLSLAKNMTGRLRKKIQSMPVPALFRKKKPKEYKLQMFVAILFLTIILLVGSIYVIHQEKELQKSYFDRIRFSHKDRRIFVKNLKGREVLRGVLGTQLTPKDKAWPCLESDSKKDYTCLEWMDKSRLYMKKLLPHSSEFESPLQSSNPSSASTSSPATSHSHSNPQQPSVQCYEIFWESLSPSGTLKDCFELGEKWGGHFYGGGELPGSNHWPLNKTQVPYSPFLTGNKVLGSSSSSPTAADSSSSIGSSFQWGRTLKRFFVNSEGAAIEITEDTPLHVSINEGHDKRLCLGAQLGSYGFDDSLSPNKGRSHLNYTICTGGNAHEMYSDLADKDMSSGLLHPDVQKAKALAQSPIWRILPEIMEFGNHSEIALLNHTDKIAALHLSEGFILMDSSWQKHLGDLEMDSSRFPTMGETFNITRRRGFKVALTIQPFFSTKSPNYEEGLQIGPNGIWLSERSTHNNNGNNGNANGKNRVPALTQYKDSSSVAVLDTTNPHAQAWLEKKVSSLVDKYGIDALYLDLGTAYDLPQFYEFSSPLSSSDFYKDLFLKALRNNSHLTTIGVSSAVKLPKLPTFVSLSPVESSWEGLQSVIPNLLSMGVAGYPFVIPGAIGGDFFSPRNISLLTDPSLKPRSLPSRDLYVRWLELAHFLPVVQYSFLPSDYDNEVVDLATKMYVLRNTKVYKYIKKAIDESLQTGLPIIRPLWMIDPTDPNCLKVSDEFSIGEDIVVAPVLHPNEQYREIYLPKGMWRNEIDGSPTKGEKWLHNYPVRKDQIPFFTKIQDGKSPT